MKYLCLAYVDETMVDALPKDTFDALTAECLAYGEELRRHGHFVGSEALQPSDTAIVVRVRDGKLSATDGPFAETKEQIGGFYIIDARDLDEAIHLASKMPPARMGSIEVRPLKEAMRARPRTLEALQQRKEDILGMRRPRATSRS